MLAGAINYRLHHGDCLDILPTLPDASIDAIITDPPYPYIKRPYGYWTEAEWMPMMQEVVRQSRRILKPSGSMVIILQPNQASVGNTRIWLWRFMVWVGEYWNIVQDFWWWNTAAVPLISTHQGSLARPSLKACVWAGLPYCYRNLKNVLLPESDANRIIRETKRLNDELHYSSSGHQKRWHRTHNAAVKNGGVSPFNVLPIPNTGQASGNLGHGAGTPLKLCDWWTRYLCPPGGVVGDWFAGTATTGIAALQNGCSYVGIEKMDEYIPIAEKRLSETMPLFQEAG